MGGWLEGNKNGSAVSVKDLYCMIMYMVLDMRKGIKICRVSVWICEGILTANVDLYKGML